MQNLSNGVAQQNLSPVKLSEQKVLLPNEGIMISFNKIVSPIVIQIINLYKNNQLLKEARDILLPRLINRAIEV